MDTVETKTGEQTPAAPTAPAAAPEAPKLPTPPPSTTASTTPTLEKAAAEHPGAEKTAGKAAGKDTIGKASIEKEAEKAAELDFAGNIAVNDDLPSAADLARIDDLVVLDSRGESRPFSAVYRGDGTARKQVVIFIRHFFCGNCQEYLRELCASVTPEALLALPEPAFISVIGCGRPELIDMYTSTTSCAFPIYADPTGRLYEALGMTRTLELGKKPGYIQSNLLVTSVQSVVQALRTGTKALKGGSFKQVGGEFLFEAGACVWVHRMRNTRDHTEVAALRERLGMDGGEKVVRKRWSHGVKKVTEKNARERSSSWAKR